MHGATGHMTFMIFCSADLRAPPQTIRCDTAHINCSVSTGLKHPHIHTHAHHMRDTANKQEARGRKGGRERERETRHMQNKELTCQGAQGQDLGAWGAVAERRPRPDVSVVAPSIWSDDEDGSVRQSASGTMHADVRGAVGEAGRGGSRSLEGRSRNGTGVGGHRGAGSEATLSSAPTNGRGSGGGLWGGGGAALRNASSPRSGNGSGSERGFGSEGSVTSAGAGKKGKGRVSAGTPPAVPSGKCMCEKRIKQTRDEGEMYDAAHPARAGERESEREERARERERD